MSESDGHKPQIYHPRAAAAGLELIKNLSIQEIWSSLYRGRGDCLRRAKLSLATSRFAPGLARTGSYPRALAQRYRDEQAAVSPLNQQCHLLVVLLHHFPQLRDALHRCAIDGKNHIARLDAGLGSVALNVFDDQTAAHTGLLALIRIQRTHSQA